MKKSTTGVLLINLGSPESPKTADVRSYLYQFLNDPRVIDIPWLLRLLLFNLIVIPFRAPSSAKAYRLLWTDEGAPLLLYTEKLAEKLQHSLGDSFAVHFAMRYKKPALKTVLADMQKQCYHKIIVVPLFPQYASASTGSALQKAMEIISKWWIIPEIAIVSQYYDHPGFLKALVAQGKKYDSAAYDHVLFSFHGLPVRHLDKVYPQGLCEDRDCADEVNAENQYCYKATCYHTARLMAEQLQIPQKHYTVTFQSRLGKDPWLEPFTDKTIINRAKQGHKKLLVFSPAFTADCLETTIEIGIEYQELFEEAGGEKIQLVESLNDTPLWVDALKQIILERAR